MSFTIQNNEWLLEKKLTNAEYNATLKTADTFIDKNINVHISVDEGQVIIPSQDIALTPLISDTPVNGVYTITLNGEQEIIPQLTAGYISSIEAGTLSIHGTIELPETTLSTKFITSTDVAGYSDYQVKASKGYNSTDLTKNIKIYQGTYDNT